VVTNTHGSEFERMPSVYPLIGKGLNLSCSVIELLAASLRASRRMALSRRIGLTALRYVPTHSRLTDCL
jgi:hypothetical protein